MLVAEEGGQLAGAASLRVRPRLNWTTPKRGCPTSTCDRDGAAVASRAHSSMPASPRRERAAARAQARVRPRPHGVAPALQRVRLHTPRARLQARGSSAAVRARDGRGTLPRSMSELAQLLANGLVTGSIIAIAAIGLTLGLRDPGDRQLRPRRVPHVRRLHRVRGRRDPRLADRGVDRVRDDRDRHARTPARAPGSGARCAGAARKSSRSCWSRWARPCAARRRLPRLGRDPAAARRRRVPGLRPRRRDPPVATQITAVSIAFAAILVVALTLARTKLGKSIARSPTTATSPPCPASTSIGSPPTPGSGARILAGLGGVLLGLVQGSCTGDMGFTLLLPIFAAVILGGVGSAYGCLVGGVGSGSPWSCRRGVPRRRRRPRLQARGRVRDPDPRAARAPPGLFGKARYV